MVRRIEIGLFGQNPLAVQGESVYATALFLGAPFWSPTSI